MMPVDRQGVMRCAMDWKLGRARGCGICSRVRSNDRCRIAEWVASSPRLGKQAGGACGVRGGPSGGRPGGPGRSARTRTTRDVEGSSREWSAVEKREKNSHASREASRSGDVRPMMLAFTRKHGNLDRDGGWVPRVRRPSRPRDGASAGLAVRATTTLAQGASQVGPRRAVILESAALSSERPSRRGQAPASAGRLSAGILRTSRTTWYWRRRNRSPPSRRQPLSRSRRRPPRWRGWPRRP